MSQFTILAVDDEADIRDLLSVVLTTNGYGVITAGNGQEALSIVENSGTLVDAIISDLRMPGMSGIRLATEVRHRRPQLPVIMITGNWDEVLSDMPPGSVVLRKPFDIDRLMLELQLSLQPSRSCAVQ